MNETNLGVKFGVIARGEMTLMSVVSKCLFKRKARQGWRKGRGGCIWVQDWDRDSRFKSGMTLGQARGTVRGLVILKNHYSLQQYVANILRVPNVIVIRRHPPRPLRHPLRTLRLNRHLETE